MTLKKCIIHHIERSSPGAEVSTALKDQENNCQGSAYSLFEQLKQSHQRSSQKQFGHFNPEQSDNPLPGWLRDFQQGKSPFTRMSGRLLEQLQQQLSANDEAFSAHIIIAIDTVMDQDQLYIFWVNHVEGTHINNDLEVANCQFIDGSKLYYSARLLLDEWLQEETQNYLSMITSRGNKTLSDSFSHFMGFNTGVDLIEETGEFLTLVDEYTQSLPTDKLRDQREKIMDYCIEQDKQGSPIVFEEISSQLDNTEPAAFSSFISEHQQVPKTEIYTDRNSLKRYVRYYGRDKNMSISFSSEMFGEDILYDQNAGTLTIKKLPKSLQKQLKASLQSPD